MCLEYEIQGKTQENMYKNEQTSVPVSPLELAHLLFDDHVFVIMSTRKTDNSGSRLLRTTMVLNQQSFIGYTMRGHSLIV
jgi:hypothetical protein